MESSSDISLSEATEEIRQELQAAETSVTRADVVDAVREGLRDSGLIIVDRQASDVFERHGARTGRTRDEVLHDREMRLRQSRRRRV